MPSERRFNEKTAALPTLPLDSDRPHGYALRAKSQALLCIVESRILQPALHQSLTRERPEFQSTIADRFRGAYPHQLSSYALLSLSAFRARGAQLSATLPLGKEKKAKMAQVSTRPEGRPLPYRGKALSDGIRTPETAGCKGQTPALRLPVSDASLRYLASRQLA